MEGLKILYGVLAVIILFAFCFPAIVQNKNKYKGVPKCAACEKELTQQEIELTEPYDPLESLCEDCYSTLQELEQGKTGINA